MTIPEKLRHLILQRQCVAFVGAGFSMPCGMPGWEGLLWHLRDVAKASVSDDRDKVTIERMEFALRQKHLQLAAGIIRDLLQEADLNRAISEKYSLEMFYSLNQKDKRRMRSRLKNLVVAPWAGIITTNYDSLIEFGLKEYTKGNFDESSADSANFGSVLCTHSAYRKFFVKIHGSVVGGKYVLGTEEYDRTYLTDPRVSSFLNAVMLRYHVVFIGCSLEDEILRLRRRLCHYFDRNIPAAYALLPDSEYNDARRRLLQDQAQITSLLYSPREGRAKQPHQEVDLFLSQACMQSAPAGLVDGALNANSLGVLRSLDLVERLRQVGVLNREILSYVSQSGGGLSHIEVLNPKSEKGTSRRAFIERTTPEERMYRTFFLISIGLLKHKMSPDGGSIYCVEDKIRRELLNF